MTEKFNDGGPAFPWGEHGSRLGGMSLRDWFAGQALSGLLAAQIHGLNANYDKAFSDLSYVIADAMLAARQRAEAEDA